MPSGVYQHKPWSLEQRKNLSEKLKGKPKPWMTKWNKKFPRRKGQKNSEEHRKKISNALTGKKLSKEHIENLKKSHKGIKLSEKTKRKMSEARKGNKHWNWKGDISSLRVRVQSSREYKLWRKAIFERDNYICQICGQRGGRLEAHHILPYIEYPALRFAINNGITLCYRCHHSKGRHKFTKEISKVEEDKEELE